MTAAQRNSQAGLTLVELMVSLVIVSIAVAATLAVGSSLNRSYQEHRTMVKVARAARGSVDYMAEALRSASPGVETGEIEDLVFCTGDQAIQIVEDTNAPDEVWAVYGRGGVYTQLTAAFAEADASITVGTVAKFAVGDFVVITNGTIGHLFKIDATAAGSLTLHASYDGAGCAYANLSGFPGGSYPAGSFVIRAMYARFRVVTSAATGNVPTLVMDDGLPDTPFEPLAAGIENLQVSAGVDMDANAIVTELGAANDDDEWFYNIGVGGVAEAAPPLITALPWRAVRISVIARSVIERSEDAAFTAPALEDHAAGATPDVFRRRVASTIVELRNLKGSPQ